MSPATSDAGGTAPGAGPAPGAGGPPVFVLTTARSGSTLLRFILDAHPDLCCPPELSAAAACAQLANVWSVTEGAPSATPPTELAQGQLSAGAMAAIRSAIESPLGAYTAERGAARWCDKSLDGAVWAGVVAAIWPDAQFICLYRHCMDVVASGLEACRWGLDTFGFEAYAHLHPGNSVAAVGACWADMTAKIVDFEKRNPGRALRVRYEDLVTDPEGVAGRIFAFLGVAQAPGISRSCFAVAHDANGPGDAKIWFTKAVSPDSVGRGLDVPGDRLPAPLRAAINDTLRELGYVEVGEDWNSGRPPADLRRRPGVGPPGVGPPGGGAHAAAGRDSGGAGAAAGQDSGGAGAAAGQDSGEAGAAAGRRGGADAAWVTSVLGARSDDVRPGLLEDVARCWPALAGRVLGVDVTGPAGRPATFRWTLPGGSAQEAGESPQAVLSAPAGVWRPVLAGAANLFGEVFARRVLASGARDAHRRRTEEVHALGVLLGVAQLPVARRRPAGPARPAVTPPGG